MRPRPIIPSGRAGLLVLAAAAVPLVISRCKPIAKAVGDKMVAWGEKLQKEAEKPSEPVAEKPSSNADMATPKHEETLKSASPAGKDEVKEQVAVAAAPKKSPPKPKVVAPKKEAAKPRAGATTNPKKTAPKK